MKRRTAVVALLASGLSAACGSIANSFARPGFGAVIRYELAKGAEEKPGLLAVSDTGSQLFASATLSSRNSGNLSFAGASVPNWVRVTWRTAIYGKLISSTGRVTDTLDFGEIIGDYKVEIASRIPAEVLRYASRGRGRAIYLVFRIKDDGVLLSWSVQETVRDPKTGGTGRVYSLYGGDLSCDDPGGLIKKIRCTSGYLKDAPWYNPSWEFI
ncbi:hypothetical protein [Thauera sp. WB-2]|uniref:hypothetical protein n=1 Tax=Thauera sp. WB-2 TaxID=2897772 RepID=UPI0022DDB9ED|nr:hypothetical protein [Thauera sp. WB-2]WBL62841.1 hypothetical protein LQF09_12160 [Thauera sp. WB-2]